VSQGNGQRRSSNPKPSLVSPVAGCLQENGLQSHLLPATGTASSWVNVSAGAHRRGVFRGDKRDRSSLSHLGCCIRRCNCSGCRRGLAPKPCGWHPDFRHFEQRRRVATRSSRWLATRQYRIDIVRHLRISGSYGRGVFRHRDAGRSDGGMFHRSDPGWWRLEHHSCRPRNWFVTTCARNLPPN
jgi:hypothetical protein